MFKKSNWVNRDAISFLSILCLGFVFSFLYGASCNNSGKKTPAESSYSSTTNPSDTARLNWLDGPDWDSFAFRSDPSDTPRFEKEKRDFRFYVRGYLAEW